MSTINDVDSKNVAYDSAWTAAAPQTIHSNELPEELAVESEKHYKDVNVRYLFANLAIQLEQSRDSKIFPKNSEMRDLRDKLRKITDFLDLANNVMVQQNGNTINLAGSDHAECLRDLKNTIPESAVQLRGLIGDKSEFKRRDLELLCQSLTRYIERDINPVMDELKEDIIDIMELLNKMLPILKDILKKSDEHIAHILRQPR